MTHLASNEALTIIEELRKLGEQHGDVVVQTTLRAIQWEAQLDLLLCIPTALLVVACFAVVLKAIEKLRDDENVTWIPALIVSGITGAIATITVIITLLSSYTWIALNDPAAAFVLKVLKPAMD
jgi:hypothetical protein